ncbi:hypothetical protein RHMOL_Rhmol01G0291000 [Rhododendron molle]|uniref:Uncharacterized protein n=1 Tax=Rhododendron molle TaxID=49168 RepID=A0ACC0Q6H1_RHOML|nr:hypothetical protein RHMOL_Rhmol01G0291000 [Rhododendron molle]
MPVPPPPGLSSSSLSSPFPPSPLSLLPFPAPVSVLPRIDFDASAGCGDLVGVVAGGCGGVAVMVLVVMAASGRRWGGGQRCCWMLTGCLVEGRKSRSPGQQQGLVPRVSGVGAAAARPFTGVRGVRLRGALAAWGFVLLWGCGQQQGGWRLWEV